MALALLKLRNLVRSLLPPRHSDRGAAMVEYALLLVLMAVVLLIAVAVVGEQTSEGISETGSFVN